MRHKHPVQLEAILTNESDRQVGPAQLLSIADTLYRRDASRACGHILAPGQWQHQPPADALEYTIVRLDSLAQSVPELPDGFLVSVPVTSVEMSAQIPAAILASGYRLRLEIRIEPQTFAPLDWTLPLARLLLEYPNIAIVAIDCAAEHRLSVLERFADMLAAMRRQAGGYRIISCPTCSRCRVNLPELVREAQQRIAALPPFDEPVEIALMGCEVNGPGEARAADVGVAWGGNRGRVFRRGQVVAKVSADELVDRLLDELQAMRHQGGTSS